jgi:hypothetical protein
MSWSVTRGSRSRSEVDQKQCERGGKHEESALKDSQDTNRDQRYGCHDSCPPIAYEPDDEGDSPPPESERQEPAVRHTNKHGGPGKRQKCRDGVRGSVPTKHGHP